MRRISGGHWRAETQLTSQPIKQDKRIASAPKRNCSRAFVGWAADRLNIPSVQGARPEDDTDGRREAAYWAAWTGSSSGRTASVGVVT